MTETAIAQPPMLLLVTGPSGAGRSTAVNALEDIGFEVIDNLPLSLLPRLIEGPLTRPLALGLDVRNRDFSTNGLIAAIDGMTETLGDGVQVLYLDADEDTLLRRYSETRRTHPLASDGTPQLGIATERDVLGPIKARSDFLVDTSSMSPHELRSEMERLFGVSDGQRLGVSVQSFSYKRGLPRGLDIVLDCRFLRNPHWDAALRPLDGRNKEVADYVAADPRFDDFFARLSSLIALVLPAHKDEGKSYLSIGFGCTGGKHRSVFVAERMAEALAQEGWQVSKRHREMERRDAASQAIRMGQQT